MQSISKTCSGRQILSKYLIKSITPNDVDKLTSITGFSFDKQFLKLGLIKMYCGDLVINGNFHNKLITVICKNNIDDTKCIELANNLITQIETLLT